MRQSERRTIRLLAPSDHKLIESVVDRESYLVALAEIVGDSSKRLATYLLRMTSPYTMAGGFVTGDKAGEVVSSSRWHDAGYEGDPDAIACKLEDERRHGTHENDAAIFFGNPSQDTTDEDISEQRGLHNYLSIGIGVVDHENQIAESIMDAVAIRSR
jgi:hypothetical protein